MSTRKLCVMLLAGAALLAGQKSASATLDVSIDSEGTVHVVGTNLIDEIHIKTFIATISRSPGFIQKQKQLKVTIIVYNGVLDIVETLNWTYPVAYVDRIVVDALDGTDWIFNETNIPSALNGGKGVDHLFGGDGADVLDGGEDGDVLVGGGGDDILLAGDDGGGNALYGENGRDTYFYNAKDYIFDNGVLQSLDLLGPCPSYAGWGWMLTPDASFTSGPMAGMSMVSQLPD
jgi:Ca2+-binding RTX toxin-like protein